MCRDCQFPRDGHIYIHVSYTYIIYCIVGFFKGEILMNFMNQFAFMKILSSKCLLLNNCSLTIHDNSWNN